MYRAGKDGGHLVLVGDDQYIAGDGIKMVGVDLGKLVMACR